MLKWLLPKSLWTRIRRLVQGNNSKAANNVMVDLIKFRHRRVKKNCGQTCQKESINIVMKLCVSFSAKKKKNLCVSSIESHSFLFNMMKYSRSNKIGCVHILFLQTYYDTYPTHPPTQEESLFHRH